MYYHDPDRAMDWLEAAFGLTRLIEVRDKSGALVHAEMQHDGCSIVIDGEWEDFVSSPASLKGETTQIIYVQVERDLDAHCRKARRNGPEILSEPEEQYYGNRLYRAKDTEGHIWTFSQAVKIFGREGAEQAGGST
ncbi:VOC family protein [Ruegeria haliotis]|uniref:VOC family protein n=1 Tax=Ruegeria haliotis TaxID=2747601 RepID=UPI001B7D7BBA|nr:VOC family protein [Ruegeria haliotis]